MEIFQLPVLSWFLPRESFLKDEALSTRQEPVFSQQPNGAIVRENFHRIGLVNYEHNFEVYKWRHQQLRGVVPIYNIEVVQTVRTEARISVLCEKMLFRFEDLLDTLPLGEQLHLLKEVVEAVELLSGRFNCFQLTSKMVGLNKEGECKLWFNQNHASNDVEYPCQTIYEQYWTVILLFRAAVIKNTLFKDFLGKMEKHNASYTTIINLIAVFASEEGVQVASRVDVTYLLSSRGQFGSKRSSDMSLRPSFGFKQGNDSTQMTESRKEYSIASQDSIVRSDQLMDNASHPKFILKIPHRKKMKQPSGTTTKPLLSQLLGKGTIFSKVQECKPSFVQSLGLNSRIESLGLNSRIQESIIFESEIRQVKPSSFASSQLQRLGKIGTLCSSMTAEQLILQQFKGIYD